MCFRLRERVQGSRRSCLPLLCQPESPEALGLSGQVSGPRFQTWCLCCPLPALGLHHTWASSVSCGLCLSVTAGDAQVFHDRSTLLTDSQVFCGVFLAKIYLRISRGWNNMNYGITLEKGCHFLSFLSRTLSVCEGLRQQHRVLHKLDLISSQA